MTTTCEIVVARKIRRQFVSKVKTPGEKKRLSYEHDRRNPTEKIRRAVEKTFRAASDFRIKTNAAPYDKLLSPAKGLSRAKQPMKQS